MAAIPENPRAQKLRQQAERRAASRMTRRQMEILRAFGPPHPLPVGVRIGLFCAQTLFVGVVVCAWQWFVAYGEVPGFGKIPAAVWGWIYLVPYLIALSVIIFVLVRKMLEYVRDNVDSERNPSGWRLSLLIGSVLFAVGVTGVASSGWEDAGIWLAIAFAFLLMGVLEGVWRLHHGVGCLTVLFTYLVGKFAAFLAADLHRIGNHLALVSLTDSVRPDLPFVVGLQQALLQADSLSRSLLLRAHGAAAAGVILCVLCWLLVERADGYRGTDFPRTFREWSWWSVVHASAMWLWLGFLACLVSARLFLP